MAINQKVVVVFWREIFSACKKCNRDGGDREAWRQLRAPKNDRDKPCHSPPVGLCGLFSTDEPSPRSNSCVFLLASLLSSFVLSSPALCAPRINNRPSAERDTEHATRHALRPIVISLLHSCTHMEDLPLSISGPGAVAHYAPLQQQACLLLLSFVYLALGLAWLA